ncbi:MAG: ABC transporter ATP-binding protein [Symbiobacteriaceae bacterium]|nr:ABC transporter ATP-binding protein [Symbiobacteriaceae bacterium]
MRISLEHVTVRFPDRQAANKEVIAVDHVSLEIPAGKLVCLLGPSGCGKSTTLYAIAGLQPLDEGRIFFGENDVTTLDATKRGIGFVFQNYALYPHMNVRENISFPLRNAKWQRSAIQERVLEVARIVQIGNLLDRKPSQLSGGQQQRVAIARALAKNPPILLLDEPLSNLDAKLRHSTREEIRRIQKTTGITTIFVTHDQEEAMSISDEVIIMRDGHILQTGRPQGIYEEPRDLFVATFIGSPAMNILPGRLQEGELWYGEYSLGEVSLPEGVVWLGVRPEGLTPHPRGEVPTMGAIPASVIHVELLGREALYQLRLAGGDGVTMITAIDTLFREDEEIEVQLQMMKRYLFADVAQDAEQKLLLRF